VTDRGTDVVCCLFLSPISLLMLLWVTFVCDVAASGDQLKQRLDNLSDSVSDNVRDRGI